MSSQEAQQTPGKKAKGSPGSKSAKGAGEQHGAGTSSAPAPAQPPPPAVRDLQGRVYGLEGTVRQQGESVSVLDARTADLAKELERLSSNLTKVQNTARDHAAGILNLHTIVHALHSSPVDKDELVKVLDVYLKPMADGLQALSTQQQQQPAAPAADPEDEGSSEEEEGAIAAPAVPQPTEGKPKQGKKGGHKQEKQLRFQKGGRGNNNNQGPGPALKKQKNQPDGELQRMAQSAGTTAANMAVAEVMKQHKGQGN